MTLPSVLSQGTLEPLAHENTVYSLVGFACIRIVC